MTNKNLIYHICRYFSNIAVVATGESKRKETKKQSKWSRLSKRERDCRFLMCLFGWVICFVGCAQVRECNGQHTIKAQKNENKNNFPNQNRKSRPEITCTQRNQRTVARDVPWRNGNVECDTQREKWNNIEIVLLANEFEVYAIE